MKSIKYAITIIATRRHGVQLWSQPARRVSR